MIVGMIGGEGKMGRLLAPILKRHVDDVLTSLDPVEIAKKSDVIIFTVPMEVTVEVIEKLLPHIKESHLLMDFTSVKEGPCRAMLRSPASVIGLHPLFGPTVSSLEGQTVVLCPERAGKWKRWISEILEKEGASVVEMTPRDHDETMATVQSLVHFCSLLFIETIRLNQKDPKKLAKMATPVYKMQLNIAGRIANQSSELYRSIQFENPYFLPLLEFFEKGFKTLRDIVEKKDREGFDRFFKNCHDFLGKEILDEGQKTTDAFIEMMKRKL
ncbi:MAG: prephenate dehydrogenase/arogenate dehydrogenase family protein [Chlamydiia bacterium]|nr:prephenate dehydrogenase/arogenate dehydrogenase family protein [Chlamydiia bacterium]